MDSEKIFVIFIVLIFGFSVVAYAISASFPGANGEQELGVAQISVEICGEEIEFPEVSGIDSNINVDSNGVINFPVEEGITLSDIFDEMNKTFSSNEVMGYEDGDEEGCDDTFTNEITMERGMIPREEEVRDIETEQVEVRSDYLLENGDVYVIRYF